ncbi:hypothetical protein ABEV34_23345 [Methylorubrum rhodesianum]|uniref:hypothetical protein n=1 Tax=Methylorubrum rhodesianum TaxID=29427 RepID=UPI003D2D4975
MDTIETIPTWGYKADGSAQIFALAPGADLPEGWSASPTVITDPSRATADALTMRATGLTFAHPVEEPASEPSAVDELLAALTEIDRLKGVIEAGMAENERLASELDEADKLLGAAADSYKKATDDLAAFSEQLAKAHEDTRVNAAERDAAKAAVEALTADLAQAKADLEAATAPKPATTTKGR